jgi:hypothetical protein
VVRRAAIPAAALVTGLGACASFEPEEIVIDLRVLAITAEPPDQVVDVDLEDPPDPLALLAQIVPTRVCALIADPHEARRLRYALTLCVPRNNGRCRDDLPQVPLIEGVLDDPELTQPAPALCADVANDGKLAGVVLAALEDDELGGLAGVDYGVVLRVGVDGDAPERDQFASKTLRISPRIPPALEANHNPKVDRFDGAKDGVDPTPLPIGRCVDQAAPLELVPTQRVRLSPVEAADAREVYVVPTISGDQRTFTESLTYQWLASAGSFSAATSGGPRDPATGDPAPLFSDFRAPRAEDLDGVTDISIWIVQRDERLGATWYESCVRVRP